MSSDRDEPEGRAARQKLSTARALLLCQIKRMSNRSRCQIGNCAADSHACQAARTLSTVRPVVVPMSTKRAQLGYDPQRSEPSAARRAAIFVSAQSSRCSSSSAAVKSRSECLAQSLSGLSGNCDLHARAIDLANARHKCLRSAEE